MDPTEPPPAVPRVVTEWCAEHLGSPAVEQFFGLRRISAVHGVRLDDGREVAVKIRGAAPRLEACTRVHEVLWAEGLPCARPLAGPHPLAGGEAPVLVPGPEGEDALDARGLVVTAETWEGLGEVRVDEVGPRGYAELLARIVAMAPAVADLPTLEPPVPWLWWAHDAQGRTWPPPASARWDPHRVDERIPFIVHDTARRARARLLRPDVATLPVVVGHGDLAAQNCRWFDLPDGGHRVVVHDWDSVVAMPEAVLAGNSAATFVEPDEGDLSTIVANDEFLAAYSDTRGHPLSRLEWQVAHAAGAWVAAYNAAFEYLKDGPAKVTLALLDQAEERLRRAGA